MKKQALNEGVGWKIILDQNRKFFMENPLSEIILSEMSDRRLGGQSRNIWRSVCKIIFIFIVSIINDKRIRKNVREEKAVLLSYLDKENDWGLVFPVAEELDKKKLKYYLFVSDEVYQHNRTKIKSLTYATVMSVRRFGDFKFAFLTVHDLIRIFDNGGAVRSLLKKYSLGSYAEYVDLMAGYLSMANTLYRRYFSNCVFSYSLGNRILGVLYQKYKILHFAMQHGESGENTLKFWSPFTPSNVFQIFTYGEKQKELFEKGYGTKAVAVGNMIMRIACEEEIEKDSVIYFADMSWAKSNFVYERIVKECLDEFICLYHRNKNKAKFYIKPHPKDDIEYYTNYNRIFGNEIPIICDKRSATQYLKRTKVCISLGSTVNMQAIRLGVVAVQLYKEKGVYTRQEYAYIVDNLETLDDIIENEQKQEQIKACQMKKIGDYDSDIEKPQLEVIKIIERECRL